MKNPGIDYSGGTANYDKTNGIHFGVIPMNALNEWAWEEFEADYGGPSCPECGDPVCTDFEDLIKDYYCPTCKEQFYSDDCFGEEPQSWTLDNNGYLAEIDSHYDVFLLKSPYFTYAQFCSPCAPGAGYLLNPCSDGPKTYCFGPDWFEDDTPPYDVYSVETGELVCKAGEKPTTQEEEVR